MRLLAPIYTKVSRITTLDIIEVFQKFLLDTINAAWTYIT